jgi:predicted GNAT superfamily acetyltransferase
MTLDCEAGTRNVSRSISLDVVQRAQQTAGRAARAADVTVTELAAMTELYAAAELFVDQWGFGGGYPPVAPNLMRALAYTGNYVAGAWAGEALIGASAGFLQHTPAGLALYSQITAVRPGTESRGVGYALKMHQRGWALARGLDVVHWTFDPLVRRNAYFNITKLGAVGAVYLPHFYGLMRDDINGTDESDRLLVRWCLREPAAVRAADGSPDEPDPPRLLAAGVPVLLRADPESAPVIGADARGTRGMALCQVPEDIVTIRARDAGLARAWRVALRGALRPALETGFVAGGISRDGWYLLLRTEGA